MHWVRSARSLTAQAAAAPQHRPHSTSQRHYHPPTSHLSFPVIHITPLHRPTHHCPSAARFPPSPAVALGCPPPLRPALLAPSTLAWPVALPRAPARLRCTAAALLPTSTTSARECARRSSPRSSSASSSTCAHTPHSAHIAHSIVTSAAAYLTSSHALRCCAVCRSRLTGGSGDCGLRIGRLRGALIASIDLCSRPCTLAGSPCESRTSAIIPTCTAECPRLTQRAGEQRDTEARLESLDAKIDMEALGAMLTQ